jgi:hypothetical protein
LGRISQRSGVAPPRNQPTLGDRIGSYPREQAGKLALNLNLHRLVPVSRVINDLLDMLCERFASLQAAILCHFRLTGRWEWKIKPWGLR